MAWWPSLVDPRPHLPGGVTTLPFPIGKSRHTLSLPAMPAGCSLRPSANPPSAFTSLSHFITHISHSRDSPPVAETEDETHHHSQFLRTPPLDIHIRHCLQGHLQWSTRYMALPMPVHSQNMATTVVACHASPSSYGGRPPTQVVSH